jgi:hypothetical protein
MLCRLQNLFAAVLVKENTGQVKFVVLIIISYSTGVIRSSLCLQPTIAGTWHPSTLFQSSLSPLSPSWSVSVFVHDEPLPEVPDSSWRRLIGTLYSFIFSTKSVGGHTERSIFLSNTRSRSSGTPPMSMSLSRPRSGRKSARCLIEECLWRKNRRGRQM